MTFSEVSICDKILNIFIIPPKTKNYRGISEASVGLGRMPTRKEAGKIHGEVNAYLIVKKGLWTVCIYIAGTNKHILRKKVQEGGTTS